MARCMARRRTVTSRMAGVTVNAEVETDADGDGFGDETQDLCDTDTAI